MDVTVQAFVTEVLKALFPILANLLVVLLVPLILSVLKTVKLKTTESQRSQIVAYVRILVKAAEQSGLTNSILQDGRAKKQFVLDELQKWLADKGWGQINVGELSNLIESEVYDQFNSGWPAIADGLADLDFDDDDTPSPPQLE